MGHDNRFRPTAREEVKWEAIAWWSRLLVAVLAIPSIAAVFALLVSGQEAWQIVMFVLACWACTLVGTKLTKR
jgi:fatty-acid desaturase